MKHKLAILVLSAAGVVAFQTQAQTQSGMDIPGSAPSAGETAPQVVTRDVPSGPEGRAEDLRLQGKCPDAIPIFRDLAARGVGFEIARYNLGLCLFDVAKVEPDAARAASLRHEAADDIRIAANGGLPNAQLRMVGLYLDGVGVGGDPVEAGKWSLLYHANGTRRLLGLPDISPELQARLDGALTAKAWADAQSRADTWSPPSGTSNPDE